MPVPGPTHPFVCLECRRSFKRPWNVRTAECPACHQPMVYLHADFKAPRSSDKKQWVKVRYLIEHGFRFRPIWDAENNRTIPYPATLREAVAWVQQFKDLPVTKGGPLHTPASSPEN